MQGVDKTAFVSPFDGALKEAHGSQNMVLHWTGHGRIA